MLQHAGRRANGVHLTDDVRWVEIKDGLRLLLVDLPAAKDDLLLGIVGPILLHRATLQPLDHLWREHIVPLEHLREVVALRGYGQRDPLNEYKTESFELFAAMLQALNERYRKHIITLEDPIEYTYESEQCLIEQRELGQDMPSFSSGLKHALRQDPDIILVGEMRDLETTALAISAAETGHLVLSTLHTVNASQTVQRVIDMYPGAQQNQIRAMLSTTLQAVVSQTLFSRIDRPGMVPAVETLLATPAVRNLIRENKAYEIPNVIETNRAIGMSSLDTSIAELYFNGIISREDAIAKAGKECFHLASIKAAVIA